MSGFVVTDIPVFGDLPCSPDHLITALFGRELNTCIESRGYLAVGLRKVLTGARALFHFHHNLAFCTAAFDIVHGFVGRLKWKDFVYDRPDDP